MEQLYLIRETIREYYSRYETYIRSVLKFLLCFIVLLMINSKLGYMSKLDNTSIVLIISLLCSFLPANLIAFFAAAFITLHSYGISLESAIVTLAVFFLMFLLYFRYSPKDALAVLLTPICFYLKIPYLMPVVFGIIGTPLSAISVSCGVISYYVIGYLASNYEAVKAMADENTVTRFKFVIDGFLQNREMIVMAAAFSVTVIVVNVIKRFSFKYSWTVAILSGIVIDIFAVIIAASRLGVKINAGPLLIGSFLSALICIVIKFFILAVDYEKTERVQFEDDDYYYYVKAVPKMTKKYMEDPLIEKRPGTAGVRSAVRNEKTRGTAGSGAPVRDEKPRGTAGTGASARSEKPRETDRRYSGNFK